MSLLVCLAPMNQAEPLPSRRRLPPKERYEQLLACAVRVFARRGLGEARHAEIADEAGVAVSTVFVYFPNREALLESVLSEVARAITEMAEIHHQGNDQADVILQEHINAFIRFAEEDNDLAIVWMDWSTAIRDQVWPAYVKLQEKIVAIISTTIKRGKLEGSIINSMGASELARLMVGSAHMLASMQFLSRDKDEIEKFSDTLLNVLVGRISKLS